jgi:replicative DNA helicase
VSSLPRQLIRAGPTSSAVFNNDGETARSLVDRAEQKVFEIAEGTFRKRDGAVAVRTLLPGVIDQIDEWHNNPDKLRGLPTGFTEFDKLTGGLRGGDLIIVAGRRSMGKTTLDVHMAEYAAVSPNTRRRGHLQHGNAVRAGHHAHARLHWWRAAQQPAQRAHHR